MFPLKFRIFMGLALACFICFSLQTKAMAVDIDFEGLGLNDADPVNVIGLVSFEAHASVQGSSYAFITHLVGSGTGTSFPFNITGNTFITNPGGVYSGETVKLIRINFATPISHLTFYVCDVDSGWPSIPTIEQLQAEAFNQNDQSIGTVTHTAPTSGSNGDGEVAFINFQDLSGIKKVEITLRNIGTNTGATAIGFGLDNIGFEYASTSIEDLLTLFDFWLSSGSIEGSGPGNSASGRLNAFRNLLEMAGDLMGTGDIDGACGQLMTAYNKCDDDSPPPDFLSGNSVVELSNQILVLMEALGCE